MKTVIIEDEKFAAEDLEAILRKLRPDTDVVAVLHSVKQASAWFSKHAEADVIFSDIHLGDGLSFEIFSNSEVKAPVIFCTAYDTYMLEAFRSNGIGYILKPYSEAEIAEALAKYERLASAGTQQEPLRTLLQQLRSGTTQPVSLLLHQGERIIPVRLEDIAMFRIHHELVQAYTFAGKWFTLNQTLDELEKFCGDKFFRASRQYLISRTAVREASHQAGRKVQVHLSIPSEDIILVSKEKVPVFLEWLART